MIKTNNLIKHFDDYQALNNINIKIYNGSIVGILGTNGAGKSTLLKTLVGILKKDSGSISIDEQDVFENISIKKEIFFIPDSPYFPYNATPNYMRDYYSIFYNNFDKIRFNKLLNALNLDENKKIKNFSKGMQRQVSILCGICSNTKYLICDETFDGLDPSIRQNIKSLFAKDIIDRDLTIILASHSLREIEDICSNIIIFHNHKVIIQKDIDILKLRMYNVQAIFKEGLPPDISNNLNVIKTKNRGALFTLTVRNDKDTIEQYMESLDTHFYEILTLNLEEIFIMETEDFGYDIKSLIT